MTSPEIHQSLPAAGRERDPVGRETVEQFDWTVDYDADGYIRLLSTFSGHIAMAAEDREQLYAGTTARSRWDPSARHRGEVDSLSYVFSADVQVVRCPSSRPNGLRRPGNAATVR
jgi:hypothetical protein